MTKYKLENIATLKYGKLPDKNKISAKKTKMNKYPIFTGYKVTGYYPEYIFSDSEVIVVARGVGGTGDVKLSPKKAFITNLSIVIQVDKKIVNKKYLQLLLNSMNLRRLDSGSAQSQITITHLKSFEVDLPPKDIQDKIADKISLIERKMQLNKQINANLMKLNTLLFQQLSVDSDYTLSNFTDCQNGFAFKSSEYITNNELLILRTLNMTSDHLFSKNGVKYISKVYKEKYQKFEFKKFDTTLVMVGASIGKMALITTNVIPSLQNQNMWRFRSKSKMPGLLIYDMVQYVNDRVRSSATGSARSFYRKKMFLNSKVPVISEKYYDIFLAIQEKINNIANENETLSNLKNVLLSKYF